MTYYTTTSTVKNDKTDVTFKGLATEGGYINQFRGIKFGTIEKRWDYPKMHVYEGGSEVDATNYGPICPQPPTESETHLLQIPPAHRQDRTAFKLDELDCLNLIITAPAKKEKLPVMVWIYGGAYTTGANSFKVYDSTALVTQSIVESSPMIVVNINYRVNFFGFSAFTEQDGFSGNYGFHDQQLALKWIKDNIEPFGGDPDNVTIVGESAGSMSVHAQCQSPLAEGLFKRAIMMSGSNHTSPPAPLQYQKAMHSYLGLPVDDLTTLQNIPADQLIKTLIDKPGQLYFSPTDDGKFFGPKWDPEYVPEWCEAIMIGDVGFESVLWARQINALNAEQVKGCLQQEGIDEDLKKKLLQVYSNLDSTSDEAARKAALEYVNDVLFASCIDRVADAFSKKEKSVYRYLFDQGNPFEGPLKGLPHHGVDIIYLFANTPLITHEEKELSKEFQSKVIKFVNGGEPWGKTSDNVMYGFGPKEHYGLVSTTEYRMRRRYRGFEAIRSSDLAKVLKVATYLMRGPQK